MITPARRTFGLLSGTALAVVLLAGCSSSSFLASNALPTPTSSTGTLRAGFYDPEHPPAPEGTITPKPGSWNDVHPPAGYTVALLSYGDEATTTTLKTAVTDWAAAEHVEVTPVVATSPDDLLDSVQRAIGEHTDLVISVGDAMVDPVAAISPSHLAQSFLVVGAEIAEPTSNVTAAEWTGAGFRGEGLGTASHYDPSTFTTERATRALEAGLAAVFNDLNGTVVWVD